MTFGAQFVKHQNTSLFFVHQPGRIEYGQMFGGRAERQFYLPGDSGHRQLFPAL